MTMVMAMGDFDLSVGSIASLAGVVAALIFVAGGPPWVAVPAALAVGLAGGLVNGVLVAYVGILPFIATLGALTVFSGFGVSPVRRQDDFRLGNPGVVWRLRARRRRTSGRPGSSIPNLTLVAARALLLTWIFLEQTIIGRRLYAIGGNAEAARLAGVRIKPLKVAAFGLSGPRRRDRLAS